MSIHDDLKKAIGTLATVTHQEGRACLDSTETQNPMETDRRVVTLPTLLTMSKLLTHFMDRKRLLQLRQPGGNPNGKNDDNGKNDKIVTDGRTWTNEYRFPDPPSHFANFFSGQSIVVSKRFPVQPFAKVVQATVCEDSNTSPYAHNAPQTHIFRSRV